MAGIQSITDCTEFQLFVLTYCYGMELERVADGQPIVTIQEIAELTPVEFLPENESQMRAELSSLVESKLLVDTYTDDSLNQQPLGVYHLGNVNGVIFVRKYLGTLVPKVVDQSQTENVINKTQGKAEVKSYFAGLFDKLKEKSQDEIASGLISGAKQYGLSAIIFLVKMMTMQYHTSHP
jgi:hypothetical protein